MSRIQRQFTLALAAVALLVGGVVAPAAQAQEMKTMAVVSISGYDQLVGDLDYIGQQIERPGLPQMLEGALAAMTAGRGTVGLDKARPWGVAIQTDGMQFEPLAFVPVTKLDDVIKTVATVTGTQPEKTDGVYELQAGAQTVYVKENNGWAYITRSSEALNAVPADPMALLDGLNEKYDFAVRVYVQNIPEVFRNLAVQQLRQGVELGLDRLPDEDEEAYQTRRRIVQNQLQQITSLVEDTNQLTFGWSIEPQNKKTYLQVSLTALPGTKLARQASELGEVKTDYAGFLTSDAAIRMNLTSKATDPEDIAQSVAMLDAMAARAKKQIDEDTELPSDEARETIKSALTDIMNVLKKTVEGGKFDAGALVKLDPEALTIAIGGHVADGPALEGALRKLAEVASEEPGFQGVEWNVAEHEGIRFHSTKAPVDEEKAQKFLGEQLEVVAGVGPTSFYIALGKSPLDTLKGIIDQSKANPAKAVAPMQLVISLGDVLNFAAAQDGDPNTARIAESLAGPDVEDEVLITLSTIENGFQYHVELEQGVLKAIGQAGTGAGAQGGGF